MHAEDGRRVAGREEFKELRASIAEQVLVTPEVDGGASADSESVADARGDEVQIPPAMSLSPDTVAPQTQQFSVRAEWSRVQSAGTLTTTAAR